MQRIANIFITSTLFIFSVFCCSVHADNSSGVPILAYHNFDPTETGSMIISTAKFEEQLKWLKDNGYTVIKLQDLVSYLQGKSTSIPEKAVVLTADDGRKSIYTYILPLARKYNVPMTLFIYPSAISNASYAMTWSQLKELQDTGLFDIQGHTYWHPNFKQEKKRLSAEEYQKLVHAQLVNSKKVIDEKLNTNISLLAWPFGIYDDYLEQQAKDAGYEMAFSIEPHPATKSDNVMALPRYMIVASQNMQTFAEIVSGKSMGKKSN